MLMDEFELQDLVENLECKVDKLQNTLTDFSVTFNSTLQEQMFNFIDCLSDNPSPDHVRDKDDYIIKLICNLGYVQSCILENQKKIIELLGGRTVGLRALSMEEKRRKIERLLNDIQDPYRKGGS